ncbi:sugar ABC transporter permease [Marinomonas hwangdonensis]|uniref:Sugar ABC transporter permease n=1 Tax=Marinomonas hwangdonensis TaxID=1053647 RepID=A0A3M8Q3P5_9GAMM|nr:sugar ABC transporter permease [Marinomonas hwangdonensis]RNF49600.1 sugar ABC transporter permease [Marinomonas hwangdonensis]
MKSYRRFLPEVGMLLPAIILMVVFIFIPFFLSGYFSFTNERLMPRPIPTQWIGLRNYERILADSEFWMSVKNTLYFAIVVIPIQLSLALASAILLNSKLKFIAVFRGITILPILTPITVIVVIWAAIFQTPDGLLNGIYQWLTGSSDYIDWLGDEAIAMLSIVLLSIWASFPFQMLIYLAGLQEIPKDRYEAAEIDGFNKWQQFRYITFPGLRNTNIFVVIITTIGALSLFTQVNILTGGGPNGSTTTIIQYMFSNGFSSQKIGYASAVSVIFFIAVASLGLLQRRLMRNE